MNAREHVREIELIRQIANKNRKAFEVFYYLFAGRVAAYLTKMLAQHDRVEEAVNDVMLTVWQSAERFDAERGKVSTWLFGIAHNKGLKLLERIGRRRETELFDGAGLTVDEDGDGDEDSAAPLAAARSNPERELIGRQLGEALSWALSQLSLEHRCVIELCFKNDCSYQEIAEIMGCPENTVKTRMFHARKRLAELLQQKGYEPV